MYSCYSGLEQRIENNSLYARSPLPQTLANYYADEISTSSISYSDTELASPTNSSYAGNSNFITANPGIINPGYVPRLMQNEAFSYKPIDYSLYKAAVKEEAVLFKPNVFINSNAPPAQFVGKAAEIMSIVEEAFRLTTGMIFPNDVMIQICSKQELKAMNMWHPGLAGFCINRKGFSFSNIFILEDSLDKVMITIGHEIGHCLSLPLANRIDEEAKAFTFSMAWNEAIRKHDLGGLAANLLPNNPKIYNPAKNGLHNVAFEFVVKQLDKGKKALEVYVELVKSMISATQVLALNT